MRPPITINIDVLKIRRAFVYGIQGKTKKVDCVCIPKSEFLEDKNGNLWLNIDAYPDTKFAGRTHALKQHFTREQLESMPKEDADGNKIYTPYVGNIRSNEQASTRISASTNNDDAVPEGDLPF